MKKCSTCMYWERLKDIDLKNQNGECRRYPGTPFPIQNGVMTVLPVRLSTYWCGEWKEKENDQHNLEL